MKYHPSIRKRIDEKTVQIAELRQLNRFLVEIQSLFPETLIPMGQPGYDKDRRVRLSWFDNKIEINFDYDHVLADASDLRKLREHGYYQTAEKGDWNKPQTDKSSGVTTYKLFHEGWKAGDVPVAEFYAGIREGDTATCKKVKVRTETRTYDVYEVRCNGMEIDEAPQIIEQESAS